MDLRRLGMVAGVLTLAMSAVGAAPAFADDASSICSVATDAVLGTSPEVIGIQVQVFDCDRRPVAFTGDLSIETVDSSLSPATVTSVSRPAQVESADGAASIALVDIGDLAPGGAVVVPDLEAAGDSVPFTSANLSAPTFGLAKDQRSTNQPYNGKTHATSPVPYAYMRFEQQQWGCGTVRLSNAACELSTRTSADQTWQKGYKLTMSWPDPGADGSGQPYTRCQVWPEIGLFWHDPADTNPISTLSYEVPFDVPAEWGSVTLPLGAATFPVGVTPGRSTIDVDYSCYRIVDGQRQGFVGGRTSDQLVPDVPPSQPTNVDAESSGDGLDAVAGGSVALGAAVLQGYEMTVVDSTGVTVESAEAAAQSMTPMRATSAVVVSSASRGASHSFRGLKPGSYTVRVAAFNSVGTSDQVSSRVVTVAASPAVGVPVVTKPKPKPALGAPRKAHVSHAHGRYRVSWTSPSEGGGGIARYTIAIQRHGHTAQRITVRSSVRSITLKRVAVTGRYRVVITAVAKDGRSKAVSRAATLRH